MKTKLLSALTAAAAAATALLGFSGSAHAFGFGTNGISFQQDTQVKFTFVQSMGANLSNLGIYKVNGGTVNPVTDKVATLFQESQRSDSFNSIGNTAAKATGYLGTAANLTGPAQVSFTFLANQVYTMGLFNQGWQSTWTRYSTTSLNTRYGLQHAAFGSSGSKTADGQALAGVSTYQSTNPFVSGGVAIGFEDAADGGDRDYNDFIVNAEAVPEPITMGGLALGFGGMVMARRRMNRKTA
ncbi:MAG: DUF4114 domain-containing protein [Oscillatoria princeps RMCB-10]|nr:DUF4114 domain-containing protein [Oscillatoria princeps RMCB-10]